MVGERDRNLRRGDLAEQLGILLLQGLSAVAPVPRTEAHSLTTAVEEFLRAWEDLGTDTLLGNTPLVGAKNALRKSVNKKRKIRRETVTNAIQSPDHGRPQTFDYAKVLKRWKLALSQAEIAGNVGASPATIRWILLELGNGQLPVRKGNRGVPSA